jgi:hypothetical protein
MDMLGLSSSVHLAHIACYSKFFQALNKLKVQPTQKSQSRSYFTTGGWPPNRSSWREAPCDPRPEILSTEPFGHSPYVTSSLTRRWVCFLCLGFRLAYNLSARTTYKTYLLLLNSNCCIINTQLPSNGNVFTELLRSNGRGADYRKHSSSIVACVYAAGSYLATAVVCRVTA